MLGRSISEGSCRARVGALLWSKLQTVQHLDNSRLSTPRRQLAESVESTSPFVSPMYASPSESPSFRSNSGIRFAPYGLLCRSPLSVAITVSSSPTQPTPNRPNKAPAEAFGRTTGRTKPCWLWLGLPTDTMALRLGRESTSGHTSNVKRCC